MYGKGRATETYQRRIKADIYGFSLSHETISKIVDRVQPRLQEWQTRALESVYPFVFLDALMVNVKNEGRAVKKAVYCAIGVNTEGLKDILGIWINETEGTHFWLTILRIEVARCEEDSLHRIDGLSALRKHQEQLPNGGCPAFVSCIWSETV